jgi:hypothetical protein
LANLEISGSFLITIGRGHGPETFVVLSVNSEDGKPVVLDPRKKLPNGLETVGIFVALSAMFGAFEIPLKIVEVEIQEPGFFGLQVELNNPKEVGSVRLEALRPSTLGIVIDDGTSRGQALACSCGAAEVTSWFADRTRSLRVKSVKATRSKRK